jgi:hypothetical protein
MGEAEEPLTEASFRAPAASRLSPASPRSAPPESGSPRAVEAVPVPPQACENESTAESQEERQHEPVSHAAFTVSLQQHARPAAPQRGWR